MSNADDLTRFFAALLGGRLLPPAELEKMKTRVRGVHRELGVPVAYTAPYGLGLAIAHTPCGTAYGHDGDVPGYRPVAWANGDGRRVVEVMVNVDSTRVPWARLYASARAAFCGG